MRSASLYKVTAVTGLVCAVVLLFNVARRSGIVPENGFTESIAILAPLTGLFAIMGLCLWQRAEAGTLGGFALAFSAVGLTGATAIEYVRHFVFRFLPEGMEDQVIEAGTGTAFQLTGIITAVGVILFAVATVRAKKLPAIAVLLYVGLIPGSLRNIVPDPVLLTGLVFAAAGVGWMSLTMLRGVEHTSTAPTNRAALATG